jgi:ribosomal 30S subunit maturation factor RimM
VLVPFVAQICREIDPAGRRIVIDPPDGLVELNAR